MKNLTRFFLTFSLAHFLTFSFNASAGPCSFTPSFSGDTIVCYGSTSIYKANKTSGLSYKWTAVNGTIVYGAAGDSAVVFWSNPANGSLKLIETNGTCKDSISKVIKVGVIRSTLNT